MAKACKKVSFYLCIGILSTLMICAAFFPNIYKEILPYRFYHVLTNSMEPTIGTHSLVLAKTYDDNMQIQKDDIIIFLANRFGEQITIMHRFSHIEKNDKGETVYKTHPEGSSSLDIYETSGQDILGVYLFHIPYAGKLLLFLKSAFGLLWLCQMIVIFLIKQLVLAQWEDAEKNPMAHAP